MLLSWGQTPAPPQMWGWGGGDRGGCCHRYLLDIVRFLAPSQTDSAVISQPRLQPSLAGILARFRVPRTNDWTLTVRCCLCASQRACKRQNHRLIFKPAQIGAFEYNDPADM